MLIGRLRATDVENCGSFGLEGTFCSEDGETGSEMGKDSPRVTFLR